MANFTRFTTLPIFCHQSISFLEKSQRFSLLERVHCQIFWVFQLFQIALHWRVSKWPTMANFAKKSGLDRLQTANFGHFVGFSIFSPKMRLRLTWIGQFHPIHNFSHLLQPKHLIYGKISKIFILGGLHLQYFWVFQLFWIVSHEVAQNDPQWRILPGKWLKLSPNGQFWSFFRFCYLFP